MCDYMKHHDISGFSSYLVFPQLASESQLHLPMDWESTWSTLFCLLLPTFPHLSSLSCTESCNVIEIKNTYAVSASAAGSQLLCTPDISGSIPGHVTKMKSSVAGFYGAQSVSWGKFGKLAFGKFRKVSVKGKFALCISRPLQDLLLIFLYYFMPALVVTHITYHVKQFHLHHKQYKFRNLFT